MQGFDTAMPAEFVRKTGPILSRGKD